MTDPTVTFITGDRSNSPAYIPLVAIEVLRAVSAGHEVATGDSPTGVESVVRGISEAAGVPFTVMSSLTLEDRHQMIFDLPDVAVVAVHVEPHASSVVRSLLNLFDGTPREDALRIVTGIDLLA